MCTRGRHREHHLEQECRESRSPGGIGAVNEPLGHSSTELLLGAPRHRARSPFRGGANASGELLQKLE